MEEFEKFNKDFLVSLIKVWYYRDVMYAIFLDVCSRQRTFKAKIDIRGFGSGHCEIRTEFKEGNTYYYSQEPLIIESKSVLNDFKRAVNSNLNKYSSNKKKDYIAFDYINLVRRS